MSELITTFGPLLAFMLIPLWIPFVAVMVAAAKDLVSPREKDTVASRRESARAARATA